MHEKMKEILGKMGTTHAPGHIMEDHAGQHHQDMHEIEKKHSEGKRHHHDVEI